MIDHYIHRAVELAIAAVFWGLAGIVWLGLGAVAYAAYINA